MQVSTIVLWLTSLISQAVVPANARPVEEPEQAIFTVPHFPDKVITPTISAFVEDVLATSIIPGIAMGVVRLKVTGPPSVELAAWGRQTEEGDGDDLTPEVSFFGSSLLPPAPRDAARIL